MRAPSYVPALLFLLGLSLLAADVLVVVGTVEGPDREVTVAQASDDKLTFLVTEVDWAEPGDEFRTPGWVGHGMDPLTACASTRTGRPTSADLETVPEDANCRVAAHLFEGIRVAVVPGGCGPRFARGESVPVYYEAPAGPPITINVPDVSLALCHPVPSAGENAIAVVWVMRNETADYENRALVLSSVEGRSIANHGFVTVDASALQSDPFLRWGGVALLIASLILGVLPRAPGGRPAVNGSAGASIEVVQAGATFLRSLRNAWVTVLFVVLSLGVPLMVVLVVLAGQLESGAFNGAPREQPFLGWRTALAWDLGLAVLASVVVAGRPAWAANKTLRRWTRLEKAAPVEGEL